jgi:hypothetical protein
MADDEPVAEHPLGVGEPTVTAWAEARRRIAEGDTYRLATVRPDGRPHLMPVLAVWAEGALHFCAGGATWHVTVRDGAFHDAEGAPTAGPPPYDVYEVRPTSVFGFGTDGTFSPTRWQF